MLVWMNVEMVWNMFRGVNILSLLFVVIIFSTFRHIHIHMSLLLLCGIPQKDIGLESCIIYIHVFLLCIIYMYYTYNILRRRRSYCHPVTCLLLVDIAFSVAGMGDGYAST